MDEFFTHMQVRGTLIRLHNSKQQYFYNFIKKWRDIINLPVWFTTHPFSVHQDSPVAQPVQSPESVADYVTDGLDRD